MIGAALTSSTSSNTVEIATMAGLAIAAIILLAAGAACIFCRPKKFVKLEEDEEAVEAADMEAGDKGGSDQARDSDQEDNDEERNDQIDDVQSEDSAESVAPRPSHRRQLR